MNLPLRVARYASPLGGVLVVSDDEERLRAIDFADYEERMRTLLRRQAGPVELSPAPLPAATRRALEAYFAGDAAPLDALPLALGGTAFQRKVWAALQTVPAGRTINYGQLACLVEQPSASRAVGLANGANPIAIRVPCHRIIGTSGKLTGYAGGLWRKAWLLRHEGVEGDWGEHLAPPL